MTRIGHYEILSVLGDGGMGTVHKARDPRFDRVVAVKVLHPHFAREPGVADRFRTEAVIQAKLQHPHIVSVFDFVDDGDTLAIVQELVPGQPLDALLKTQGPQPPAWAARVIDQAASGLGHAHAQGLVHRDVKPSNVLVAEIDGQPVAKVTDFGIAKVLGTDKLRTATGAKMGTLAYMSPEHLRSPKDVDARADIYALGAVLYETLTGKPAFDADTEYTLMERIVHAPVPRPSATTAGVPPALDAVVERAMAKSPGDRYQTCDELRAALRESMADTTAFRAVAPEPARPGPAAPQPIEASGPAAPPAGLMDAPPPPVEGGQEPTGSNGRRTWALAALVAALALLGAGALVGWPWWQDRRAWQQARAANTADAVEAYLAAHPDGWHRAEAEGERERWRRDAAAREWSRLTSQGVAFDDLKEVDAPAEIRTALSARLDGRDPAEMQLSFRPIDLNGDGAPEALFVVDATSGERQATPEYYVFVCTRPGGAAWVLGEALGVETVTRIGPATTRGYLTLAFRSSMTELEESTGELLLGEESGMLAWNGSSYVVREDERNRLVQSRVPAAAPGPLDGTVSGGFLPPALNTCRIVATIRQPGSDLRIDVARAAAEGYAGAQAAEGGPLVYTKNARSLDETRFDGRSTDGDAFPDDVELVFAWFPDGTASIGARGPDASVLATLVDGWARLPLDEQFSGAFLQSIAYRRELAALASRGYVSGSGVALEGPDDLGRLAVTLVNRFDQPIFRVGAALYLQGIAQRAVPPAMRVWGPLPSYGSGEATRAFGLSVTNPRHAYLVAAANCDNGNASRVLLDGAEFVSRRDCCETLRRATGVVPREVTLWTRTRWSQGAPMVNLAVVADDVTVTGARQDPAGGLSDNRLPFVSRIPPAGRE